MRLWKRKWFVLAEFCLFYYKDSREQSVLGSIPLPSYQVSPVRPEDHISRRFAFKAEHNGMRTYFFSADTQDDMNSWIRTMNQASQIQNQVQNQVQNGVSNGVHTGTNTAPNRFSDRLDHIPVPQLNHKDQAKSSSEGTLIHEVLLEPIVNRDQTERHSFKKNSPVAAATLKTSPVEATALDMDSCTSVSAPVSRAPSQNRFPADFSRNGLVSTPSPILEPNGIAAGTYQKTPPLTTPPVDRYRQATPPGNSLQRRSLREQVQNWVKVQKDERRGPPSREGTLHRRTPPSQFSPIDPPPTRTQPEHNPPAGRVGEYRYAQDRLSHFGMSESGLDPIWRLYEWQQRLQFRHGSPTAPLYNPAPQYPYGPRPPTTVDQLRAPTPRCISVPPFPADVLPPPPPRPMGFSRRPHTPAERLTVKPTNESAATDEAFTGSPRRSKSQLFKAATIERRSMPASGYMTHTVSAPSLHGKTIDDTYLHLKKDLEYLDLKMAGQQLKEAGKPVKVAESDIDVELSRLCEQDKILKDLETRISALKEDKDKLESVLDVSHQQMEQFRDNSSLQKISLQQRLLQEDLVQIRAQMSRVYTEMSESWEEYVRLEKSVEQLRSALQKQMDLSSTSQQEKAELKRELWRIEDVTAGLGSSKNNYRLIIDSVLNPERKLVQTSAPSQTSLVQPPTRSSIRALSTHTGLKRSDDSAPPRPPLPCFYNDEDSPPEVPPLPKEASVIRHTSVRGLKRQSDERRRDRESGLYVTNGECKSDLRSFLSEPELNPFSSTDLHQLCSNTGLSGSSSGLNQCSVSAFVTLRRGAHTDRERPKSAFECSLSPALDSHWSASVQSRSRMSAEEQLERMKRHQRALVRERQRNLTDRCSSLGRSEEVIDWQEERPIAEGQSDKGWGQRESVQSEERIKAKVVKEVDREPVEYDLDISRELSKPSKVLIPERYVESDPEEPLSLDEQQQRHQRAQRIRNMLTKSSVQNITPLSVDFTELDSVLQQQQRIMNASQALASEASRKSRRLAAKAAAEN